MKCIAGCGTEVDLSGITFFDVESPDYEGARVFEFGPYCRDCFQGTHTATVLRDRYDIDKLPEIDAQPDTLDPEEV